MSDNANTPVVSMPKRAHFAPLTSATKLQDALEHPTFVSRMRDATPRHLSPDRMLATAIQSIQKTPLLGKCPVISLLGAFVSLANVGLEPNTALQHAFLIPFAKKKKATDQNGSVVKQNGREVWIDGDPQVQVIFGYQGLLELTYRSGLLRSVHADVVWEGDDFDFWFGSNGQLKHRPKRTRHEAGEAPTYAYMHANMKDGGESYEVMPWNEVLAIRDGSQAYKSAQGALKWAKDKNKPPLSWTEAPWVKHEIAMGRKTVFRSGQKWLPKSIELAGAIALDELQDRKNADFAGVIEGKANILEGGLEALSDEASDTLDMGMSGTFNGYSQQDDRQLAATGAQPSAQADAPAGQAHQGQVGPHPAQGTPQAPSRPGFEHYLLNETGGIVGDGTFATAGAFAERLLGVLSATDDKEVVIENNSEAILACKAFPDVAADLASEIAMIEGQVATAQTPDKGPEPEREPEPNPLAAPIPFETRTGAGMDAWMRKAAAILPKLDKDAMPEWLGNNMKTWSNWPTARRLEVNRMVRTRCEALGLKWTAAEPAHPPAQEPQEGPVQHAGDPGPSLD